MLPGNRTDYGRYLQGYGRLKTGVPIAAAEAELKDMAARLSDEFPDQNKGWSAHVTPLREFLVGDVRQPLMLLLGAVAILLLMCARTSRTSFSGVPRA
jgi:hypothetical protein